jgi:excisionase family DNA binding protein
MLDMIPAPPKLISFAEGAARLGVSKHTVRGWLRKGVFPYIRLGRRVLLSPIDVEKFIASNRVEAKADR